MLSICIPIYNTCVKDLVQQLARQITAKNLPVDIILIDDASAPEHRESNLAIILPFLKYVQLQQNLGRSKIRNLFLKYTQAPYLLFLDCDVAIKSENFLRDYLDAIKRESLAIINGGKVYVKPAAQENNLRWQYAITRERQTALQRSALPYHKLITGNIIIPRGIMQQIPFEEAIKQYGHEDTLLGFRCKQQKIRVVHIENAVVVDAYENNVDFLIKTKDALRTLQFIVQQLEPSKEFTAFVPLLKFYRKTKWMGGLYTLAYHSFFTKLEKRLLLGNYQGFIFDFYKLLYYHDLNKQR